MLVYAARQSSGASRSAPAAPQSDVANPCPNAGASPRRTPECASIPEAAPGRWWPCLTAAPSRRISACRPVSRSAGVPSDHAAQGRLKDGSRIASGTKTAPEENSYQPRRLWPQRRFGALSLPTSPANQLRRRYTRDFLRPAAEVVTAHPARPSYAGTSLQSLAITTASPSPPGSGQPARAKSTLSAVHQSTPRHSLPLPPVPPP